MCCYCVSANSLHNSLRRACYGYYIGDKVNWNTAMAAPLALWNPLTDTDNWTLTVRFVANGISEPAKQRAVLLSACGGGYVPAYPKSGVPSQANGKVLQ